LEEAVSLSGIESRSISQKSARKITLRSRQLPRRPQASTFTMVLTRPVVTERPSLTSALTSQVLRTLLLRTPLTRRAPSSRE